MKPMLIKFHVQLLAVILCTVALEPLSGGSENTYKEEEKHGVRNAGTDPRSYATAEKMYETNTRYLPFDATANQMVDGVTEKFKGGAMPEDREVWKLLSALGPYAKCEQIQSALVDWVGLFQTSVKPPDPEKDLELLKHANDIYQRPNAMGLTEGVANYLAFLRKQPGHLDARNNLALAAMHMNNMVAAQVQLEWLNKIAPSYAPGRINLTVLLERLGRGVRAQELSHAVVVDCPNLPAAVFNDAWYLVAKNERAAAAKSLNRFAVLPGLELGEKYQKLQQISLSRQFRWRDVGLAGLWATPGSSSHRIIAVVVFLAISVGLVFGCGNLSRNAGAPGVAGFLWALGLGAACYLACWGLPGSLWLAAAYLAAVGLTAAKVANS